MGLMSHRENSSPSGWGCFVLRLGIHPLYPTPRHRPCRFLFPPPVFHVTINYFPLRFSRNKKNLSCRRLNTQSDTQKTLQSKEMTGFWALHDCKQRACSVYLVKCSSGKKKMFLCVAFSKLVVCHCPFYYFRHFLFAPYSLKLLFGLWKSLVMYLVSCTKHHCEY